MNVELFLKNNMWCSAYNCSNISENSPDKIFFVFAFNAKGFAIAILFFFLFFLLVPFSGWTAKSFLAP